MRAVTLLGSGGGARAVLMALRLMGFHMVRIQSRNVSEAFALAVQHGLEVQPVPFDAPIEGDGLINATPLGMAGKDCLYCDLSHMPANGWVFDMVTDPPHTPLVAAAKECGLAVLTGLDMLVEQAATSFTLFFGAEPPRDREAELWQKLGR
jgi:shikimate dehydrogenase